MMDPGATEDLGQYVPIYPEQRTGPEAAVSNIHLSINNHRNRTLIGGPVTNVVKAVIDYTTTVTRGPLCRLLARRI